MHTILRACLPSFNKACTAFDPFHFNMRGERESHEYITYLLQYIYKYHFSVVYIHKYEYISHSRIRA